MNETKTTYLRPKTRGELMDALRNDISCEVVASNQEITSLLLSGYARDIIFTVKNSPNLGWVIYENKSSLKFN